MKKKVILLLLLLVLLLSTIPVLGAELSVSTEETLIKGITYRHLERLEGNGWQDIHILTPPRIGLYCIIPHFSLLVNPT